MQILQADKPAVYRCDVCGREGFWRSDGFQWEFYGGMEGDGLHTCSAECRARMGDPAKAFRKLFVFTESGDGRWADRKHMGLLGDKPKREPREDDDPWAPTESRGPLIACPKCRERLLVIPTEEAVAMDGAKRIKCECGAQVVVWTDITYTAAVEKRPKPPAAARKE